MEIPELENNNLDVTNTIPLDAAELPQEEEAPEVQPFKLSFAKYNPKECEIDGINPHNGKAILTIVRDIGIYFTNEENFTKKSSKDIEIKHVINGGDYKKLYRGLYEDEEVREIKYKHSYPKKGIEIDVRLFFCSLEKEKTFYIIAVRESHYDTSKSIYK
jgi:hypothetical protein